MKKHLLYILFLFIAQCLGAQEIKVLEIQTHETSVKARVAQVHDNNGDLCALVEVAAPKLEGLAFDESRHVGEVRYSDGVYSLFVPAGTKTVGFKHRDYMPGTIDFGAFGVMVESGMVYSVGLQRTDVAQEYQFLVISVQPSSAFVEVDGQPQNVTNGIAQMLLPVGTVHHYKVSGNGMQTEEGDVVIRSADEKTTVNVALRSYSTKIHISSLEQASIRINGTVMGTGEWTGELTPGTYRIEAVLDGAVISNEVHEIAMSSTVQDIALEVKYGTATITSSVPNASVSVDGEPKGVTPLRLTRMTPGRHTIAISLEEYKEYTGSFVVEPSANVNVTASLEMLPQPKVNELAFKVEVTGKEATIEHTFDISTNLFDWLDFATINVDASFPVSHHFTVQFGGKFNGWEFASKNIDNIWNKQQSVSAGARYWPWGTYSKLWICSKFQYCKYSETGVWRSALEEGKAVGAGLSMGYMWRIGNHLGIDLGAGFWGGKLLEYNLYSSPDPTHTDSPRKSGPKNFIAINDLTISVHWLF